MYKYIRSGREESDARYAYFIDALKQLNFCINRLNEEQIIHINDTVDMDFDQIIREAYSALR